MHFSDLTPPSAPTRWVRPAVCAFLLAFTQKATADGGRRPASTPQSPPYLLVCLPPPLRFADPVEPADPVSALPTALGPPHPGGLLEEIAALNQEAAMPALPPATAPSEPAETPPTETPPSSSAATSPTSSPPAAPQVGVALLPDDTPRAIRAEDVLVYFQFPAAAPANDSPPPSSATFRQQ